MKVKTVVVGPLGTNCYVVTGDAGGEAIVIDPGEDALDIIDVLNNDNLDVAAIVLTHGHFDHIQAAGDLKKAKGGDIYADPADAVPGADKQLAEGQEFVAGGAKLTVLKTPGHSRGSCSLVGEGAVFCGDLLFRDSVGRTDFEGGSMEELLKSLDRLKELPDDTVVFPGHGPNTTIGREKTMNPYMSMGGR
jgi:hydroxyacylglutathione hydrolase